MIFRDETALWNFIRPSLLGRHWRRLENMADAGAGDAYGFFRRETVWIELKVGKPGIRHLRPPQYAFVQDCIACGVPVWLCFAHKDKVWFYKGVDFKCSMAPEFYRPEIAKALQLARPKRASSKAGRPRV